MNTFRRYISGTFIVHPDNISKELVSTNDVSPNVQGVVVKSVNIDGDFNNKQEFDDRDGMLTWIRRTATRLGFGVVIRRSDNGLEKRNAFVTIWCEKSEKYKTPLEKFKRDDTVLQGHPSVYRLKAEEKTCISDMTLNLVQSKNTLATLKQKEPDNLFNTLSTLLILDSTYKTNKYRLPLFELVGVTSTDKTYAVGFAFLKCEKEDNFTWELEVCRSLLKEKVDMPKAIVTDRNTPLMNTAAKVFPFSNALFCRYHISTNVRSRVKPAVEKKQLEFEGGKLVKPSVVVEQIMDAWNCILNSSTKDLYVDSVIQFWKVCKKYPALLKYVESTILDQVKEKIVYAWIDNVRHLGNTTTNRVESAHASLKN
ncbi:uncharacterized protein LOC131630516 [Vicia villosa]|uniref:uncharacterized protein LOC131630516 n=1 Tax=Vicia villosa TaxID=3911 RepID=UPI00273B7360|nr:uncharacterized protein LOC131630516 [Vicia villosa]